jgi:branched-chain amino acid transport system substrate-binding protein
MTSSSVPVHVNGPSDPSGSAGTPAPVAPARRVPTLLRHGLWAVLALVLLTIATGQVSSFANYQLAHLGAVVCAAAGLTVLIGLNGQISLGHAALMAIGGYTVALYLGRIDDTGTPGLSDLVIALLLGTVVTVVVGAVIGVAAARLEGPYLAGVTLALGVALPGFTAYFGSVLGGDQGIFIPVPGPPEALDAWVSLQRWQALIALVCVVLVMLLLANLKRSAVGRHFAAVRDDEVAAAISGLDVARVKVLAFTVSAAAAGLGGGVLGMWLGSATPGGYDLYLSLGPARGGRDRRSRQPRRGGVGGPRRRLPGRGRGAGRRRQRHLRGRGRPTAGQPRSRSLRPAAHRRDARRPRRHPGAGAPPRRTAPPSRFGRSVKEARMNTHVEGSRLGSMIRGARAPLAVGAALALLLSGCGSNSEAGSGDSASAAPGVTADEILLGTTQPLTGPAAPGYSNISKGMQAYFDYLNDNGGVNGRDVKLLVEDDAYNPSQTATATRKLVLEDDIFAMVGALGTPTHSTVLDFLNQSEVPDLFVSSGSNAWNQPDKYPFTFGWQLDYTTEGKILANYVKENLPDKKHCSFGQADDYGEDGVKGVETVLGADALAVKQTYNPANTNVGPQIGELQSADCDVVFTFTVPGFTALAMGTAAKMKYAPQWLVASSGADVPTLEGFLKENTTPLLENMISASYMALSGDDEDSWTQLFKKINTEKNGDLAFDGNVAYGMGLAYLTAQVLKAAGDNPTRQSLIDAVQAGGQTGSPRAPYRYWATDHSGMSGAAIARTTDGVSQVIGPVQVTDVGSGPIEEYTGERTQAPASGLPW